MFWYQFCFEEFKCDTLMNYMEWKFNWVDRWSLAALSGIVFPSPEHDGAQKSLNYISDGWQGHLGMLNTSFNHFFKVL